MRLPVPLLLLLQVNDQLPEAFSLLGYAFYLQPLIMPIIREMPEGKSGRQALTAAVHSSLLGECGPAAVGRWSMAQQTAAAVLHVATCCQEMSACVADCTPSGATCLPACSLVLQAAASCCMLAWASLVPRCLGPAQRATSCSTR